MQLMRGQAKIQTEPDPKVSPLPLCGAVCISNFGDVWKEWVSTYKEAYGTFSLVNLFFA